MLYDIYLIALKPGPVEWLSSAGLIVFSNNSDKLDYPFDVNEIDEDRSTRLYARDVHGRATLTLDPNAGETFTRPDKEIGMDGRIAEKGVEHP